MSRFGSFHAFGYNSIDSEPIWMEHSEYNVGGWPFLGAIRSVATAGEPGKICC